MIRVLVDTSQLSQADRDWLVAAQEGIDAKASYSEQKAEAILRWKGKSKAVFGRIKSLLQAANVGTRYCNYCEHNEPGDIEHFFPKKLFPEKAFLIENYLFACPQCNSRAKGDSFAVIESIAPLRIKRFGKQYRGPRPLSDQAAVINPLVEDPLRMLFLSLTTGFLQEHPMGLDAVGIAKAENTLWMMRLNERGILVEQRRESVGNFSDLLRKYIRAKSSSSYEELAAVVKFPDEIEESQPFELAKEAFLQLQVQKIKSRNHRTVWEEMKRQRTYHPELKALFEAAPEALDW